MSRFEICPSLLIQGVAKNDIVVIVDKLEIVEAVLMKFSEFVKDSFSHDVCEFLDVWGFGILHTANDKASHVLVVSANERGLQLVI